MESFFFAFFFVLLFIQFPCVQKGIERDWLRLKYFTENCVFCAFYLAQQRKKKVKKEVDRIEATSSTKNKKNSRILFVPPHEIFGNEEPLRSTNRKKIQFLLQEMFLVKFLLLFFLFCSAERLRSSCFSFSFFFAVKIICTNGVNISIKV